LFYDENADIPDWKVRQGHLLIIVAAPEVVILGVDIFLK
jgi:hypothetical protein